MLLGNVDGWVMWMGTYVRNVDGVGRLHGGVGNVDGWVACLRPKRFRQGARLATGAGAFACVMVVDGLCGLLWVGQWVRRVGAWIACDAWTR